MSKGKNKKKIVFLHPSPSISASKRQPSLRDEKKKNKVQTSKVQMEDMRSFSACEIYIHAQIQTVGTAVDMLIILLI